MLGQDHNSFMLHIHFIWISVAEGLDSIQVTKGGVERETLEMPHIRPPTVNLLCSQVQEMKERNTQH